MGQFYFVTLEVEVGSNELYLLLWVTRLEIRRQKIAPGYDGVSTIMSHVSEYQLNALIHQIELITEINSDAEQVY